MTKEQIYNAICDLAEDASVSPDELVNALIAENEANFEKSLGELNGAASELVKSAREQKATTRENNRKAEAENALSEEIKRFRELFPNVAASDIPDCVWEDMEKGIPLPYAYSLYTLTGESNNAYAATVNERNSRAAVPPITEGADEGELSMDEVENMSAAAVKKNFPRILRSISKWKLQ